MKKNKCPQCDSANTHRVAINVVGNIAKEVAGMTTSLVVGLPLGFVGGMLPGTAKYGAGQRAQEIGEKAGEWVRGKIVKKYICADCGHEWEIES